MDTVLTTASGALVDYLDPKNINLEDIALGLSRQPRYAGQTTQFYSVAQHCLLVAELAPLCRFSALLHDAQEAFLGDLPTPAKMAMRSFSDPSPYDELEKRLHAAICASLGTEPIDTITVHRADMDARAIESAILHPAVNAKPPQKLARRIVDGIFNLPDGGREAWLTAVRAEEWRLKDYIMRYRDRWGWAPIFAPAALSLATPLPPPGPVVAVIPEEHREPPEDEPE